MAVHDAAVFADYQRAERQGDLKALADIQAGTFREEFKTVFDAWQRQGGETIASTPFELAPFGGRFIPADRPWDSRLSGETQATIPLSFSGYQPSAFAAERRAHKPGGLGA